MSEDGFERSLTGLFGGPDWNVPVVRDLKAGLPNQCLMQWSGLSKCCAGKEQFCLMKLCNRCIVHLPLPLLESPSSVTIIFQNGFCFHKTKGIWSIKPKAFRVMAFFS